MKHKICVFDNVQRVFLNSMYEINKLLLTFTFSQLISYMKDLMKTFLMKNTIQKQKVFVIEGETITCGGSNRIKVFS